MDRTTGQPVKVNGKSVTAEKVFVPEQSYGTVDMEFTFDGSDLAGKKIVVFEKLYLDEKLAAAHENLQDQAQTIWLPELKTSAAYTESGVITDTVSYMNLIPGKEYTVKGILMDKATGKPLISDGEKIIAEKVFTADKEDGQVKLSFYFSEDDLQGKTAVVFEKLYFEGDLVGSHQDLKDKNQTVTFEEPQTPDVPEKEKPDVPEKEKQMYPADIPQTGDMANMGIYLLLAGSAIVLLFRIAVQLKKKNREK